MAFWVRPGGDHVPSAPDHDPFYDRWAPTPASAAHAVHAAPAPGPPSEQERHIYFVLYEHNDHQPGPAYDATWHDDLSAYAGGTVRSVGHGPVHHSTQHIRPASPQRWDGPAMPVALVASAVDKREPDPQYIVRPVQQWQDERETSLFPKLGLEFALGHHGWDGRDGQARDRQVLLRPAQAPTLAPAPTATTQQRDDGLLTDADAATRVATQLADNRRRRHATRHERILSGLVHAKETAAGTDSGEAQRFPLDERALESILLAANELFFGGRLTRRVEWQWSDQTSGPAYDREIMGHTLLRRAAPARGGFETCILLSTPILTDPRYSRRLLISAFLHELIHCYLFICCGWSARADGGHTPGFRAIAALIDRWAGPDTLYLSHVEADLAHFRQDTPASASDAVFGPCHRNREATPAFCHADDALAFPADVLAGWNSRWAHV